MLKFIKIKGMNSNDNCRLSYLNNQSSNEEPVKISFPVMESAVYQQPDNSEVVDYSSTQPIVESFHVLSLATNESNLYLSQTERLSTKVRSYVEWSICNTICCVCVCFPILFCSIPALIFSNQAREKITDNLYDKAKFNSKVSKVLNIASSIYILVFYLTLLITLISALIYAYIYAAPILEVIQKILSIFAIF